VRVFLDTSVLVAAFATRGLCADVFRLVLAEHELVGGETVLEELARVLSEKLRMPEARTREVVEFVRQHSTIAAETPAPAVQIRDAHDVPILAAALNGCADVLVSGDKDLLVLRRIEGMPVLDPRGFWEFVKTRAGQ
jgi:putative PIN family toxin of toxin-antitoxin system